MRTTSATWLNILICQAQLESWQFVTESDEHVPDRAKMILEDLFHES